MFICDRRTGAQQSRGLVMNEIHRRRPRRQKFGFSFVGNDRRPSSKGTRPENRDAPVSPDLSPSIRDDRGYLRFRVFISRQNLGQSRNGKIADRLGFSQHMKTRLFYSMVLVIKLRFFNIFFLCKIDREKVFCNILDRKQIFLGHKNFDLIKKSSKNAQGA